MLEFSAPHCDMVDIGTRARVAGAQAQHQAALARYCQTVLTAFGDVEDQLSATRVLSQQQALRKQASAAADQVEAHMLNRYKAGQVSYTEVVQAQATALSARAGAIAGRPPDDCGGIDRIVGRRMESFVRIAAP